MACYVITGKLGSGKNLCAVNRIMDYVKRGRPVATNIDLDLVRVCKSEELARSARVIRLPDFPSSADLANLGSVANDDDETRNGALVLDECGVLLNSREWGGADRSAVVDWMLHSRKLGWDVFLVVQSINLLDKQLRDALAEFVVYVKRMDRVAVPIIGAFVRWCTFGYVRLKLPRIHMAAVMYGSGPSAMPSDSWTFRGNDIFGAYRTKQLFSRRYEHGPYSLIPNPAPFRATGWVAPPPAEPAPVPARPLKPKAPEVAAVMHLAPDLRIPALRALAA